MWLHAGRSQKQIRSENLIAQHKTKVKKKKDLFFFFLSVYNSITRKYTWAAAWQNQQNEMCPAKTNISLAICPVWLESSLCAEWVAKDPRILHADSDDGSDWVDAQADLSLRWAHRGIYRFCHAAAHILTCSCGKVFNFEICCLENTDIKRERKIWNEV